MEQNTSFDKDLLSLFSKMIDDKVEMFVLQLLFINNNFEEVLDELINNLEQKQDD